MTVRHAILDHMVRITHLLLFHLINGSHTSIQSYIDDNEMNTFGTWGSELEMLTLYSPYATN